MRGNVPKRKGRAYSNILFTPISEAKLRSALIRGTSISGQTNPYSTAERTIVTAGKADFRPGKLVRQLVHARGGHAAVERASSAFLFLVLQAATEKQGKEDQGKGRWTTEGKGRARGDTQP